MKNRILLIGLGVLSALSLAILYVLITLPRRHLDAVLREVGAVEVGKTKLEDWRPRVERSQFSKATFKCDPRACDIGWHVENRLLRALGLAPRSVVDVSVGFKEGVASDIYIISVVAKRDDDGKWHDDRGMVVRQRADISSACHPHYELEVKRRGAGDPYWATIAMDSCVSPQDRARAIAINSSCLTQLGGCKTVESMNPQIFDRPYPLR